MDILSRHIIILSYSSQDFNLIDSKYSASPESIYAFSYCANFQRMHGMPDSVIARSKAT